MHNKPSNSAPTQSCSRCKTRNRKRMPNCELNKHLARQTVTISYFANDMENNYNMAALPIHNKLTSPYLTNKDVELGIGN